MGRGTNSGNETQPLLEDGLQNTPSTPWQRSKTVHYIIVGTFLCGLFIGAFVLYGILNSESKGKMLPFYFLSIIH